MTETQITKAYELGTAGYYTETSAAPALHPTIREMIQDLPVGGGGAQIMAAYSEGWNTAADINAELALTKAN
jgi:hypothetical protein